MKSIRFFFTFFLVIIFFSSVHAQIRNVHFFPLVPVNGDEEFCSEYSDLLKEKLIKSEVFKLTDVNNFKVNPSESEDEYERIKESLKEKCRKEKIESAIFGYVRKMGQGYHVYAELYYVENDDVISRFRDTFFIRDEIAYSTKNCTLNFVSRINNINLAKIMFSSAIVPGLGMSQMNHKYRAGIYFVGFFAMYLWQNHLTKQLKPLIQGKFSWSTCYTPDGMTTEGHPNYINYSEYYIDGVLTSMNEWNEKRSKWMAENLEILNHNDKIKKKRNIIRVSMTALYLINLLDTLFAVKNYNDLSGLEQKISFEFNPFNRRPGFEINYRF